MTDRKSVVSQLINSDNEICFSNVSETTSHEVIGRIGSAKPSGRRNLKFEVDLNVNICDEIIDPFEELHEPVNIVIDSPKKQTARDKWDLVMVSGFSPKYMAAFEKMKLKQKERYASAPKINDKGKTIIKKVSLVNESTKHRITEFIENECGEISLPEEIFQKSTVNLMKKGCFKFCIKDPNALIG